MYLSRRELCGNLCGKISCDQSEDDVRKTMEVFQELCAKDPQFTYRVQADNEGRISTLMWATGNSRLQYSFFGDVVTFDTAYRRTSMTCLLVYLRG